MSKYSQVYGVQVYSTLCSLQVVITYMYKFSTLDSLEQIVATYYPI